VGCEVRVLNPSRLALIYGSMKKTDKEDALKLAHILEGFRDGLLPTVPVPGDGEMLRRKLLASYRREVRARVQAVNRLHGLFVAQGVTGVVKKDLATGAARREAVKVLGGLERLEAEHLLACIALYERRIAELEKQMDESAEGDEHIELLQTVPGVGPKISFAFTAHVAAERFDSAKQASNFLGLVPRVYMSGDTVRYGRITKRGNGFLRALLVQGAWSIVRSKDGGALRERYEYMTKVKGISKKKAVVAVARRLGELLFVLLKSGAAYEARKFPVRKPGEKLAQLAASA
jgi:transposase